MKNINYLSIFGIVLVLFLFLCGCCGSDQIEADCKKKCMGCRNKACTYDYCADKGLVCDYSGGEGACISCETWQECPPCQGCFDNICRAPEGDEIAAEGWNNFCTSSSRNPYDEKMEEECNGRSGDVLCGTVDGCTLCTY